MALVVVSLPPNRTFADRCVSGEALPIPGVSDAQQTAAYWLARLPRGEADRVLLSADKLRELNRHLVAATSRYSELRQAPTSSLSTRRTDARERLRIYRAEVEAGTLVVGAGALEESRARIDGMRRRDQARVVFRETDLRCIPTDAAFLRPPVDPDFDRNRCSGVHPGEVVRVLGASLDGWLYVDVGFGSGWLRPTTLTPPLEEAAVQRFLGATDRLVLLADVAPWRLGTSFPIVADRATEVVIEVPLAHGLGRATLPRTTPMARGYPPLTRAGVLRAAFSQLGAPYGWGDVDGRRDCSRLTLDVLGTFDVRLGRNSASQAKAGSAVIDVEGLDDAEKRSQLTEAGQRGVVLLYMPGHIMLYLGDDAGEPYALSALSEYVVPCADKSERVLRPNRVVVSDLNLGRGTSRRSFLERITRLVIFGEPGPQ